MYSVERAGAQYDRSFDVPGGRGKECVFPREKSGIPPAEQTAQNRHGYRLPAFGGQQADRVCVRFAAGQGNVALALQDGQPVDQSVLRQASAQQCVRVCQCICQCLVFPGGAERAQQKKIRIAVCHDLSPSVSSPTAARTTVPSRRMPSRICPSEGVE